MSKTYSSPLFPKLEVILLLPIFKEIPLLQMDNRRFLTAFWGRVEDVTTRPFLSITCGNEQICLLHR